MHAYYRGMENVIGMNSFSQELLHNADTALREGKDSYARSILVWLVRKQPTNAAAWLMMSRAVEDVEHRYDCLQRALILTDDNPIVQEQVYELERIITGKNCNSAEATKPWPETSELMPLPVAPEPVTLPIEESEPPAYALFRQVNARHLLMLSGLSVIMFAYVFG